MNTNFSQKSLAISKLTLEYLARGAPLEYTLNSIARDIEEQNPTLIVAIFILDEDDYLYLNSAPAFSPALPSVLPPDYLHAIDRMKLSDVIQDSAKTALTHRASASFIELALQHDLYVHAITRIHSGKHVHGILVTHSKTAAIPDEALQQALIDSAALASIALESHLTKSKLKAAEDALRHNETIMALAIEGSGTGIWDRNIQTNQINYSNGWKAILGYTPNEVGNRIEDSYTRVHPDDLDSVQDAMQAHFDHQTDNYAVEHRIRCKDGSYKWISSRGKIVQHDAAGKPMRMVGTTTDVTAMRSLSEELQQSVKLITSLTNEVPGLVYQCRLMPNGDAFFSYASEGIKDIYEIDADQVVHNLDAINQLIHPEDLTRYQDSLAKSAADLMPWHLEYRVVLPTQGVRWRQGDAHPRRLENGSLLWHGFITDVTERKRLEIELEGFATIDFLTQIPNRRYFITRMEEELARLQRVSGARAAVLMCDLDHFKGINDRYGHAVGDLVLKHFAMILRDAIRKIDTAGRVGGEEFAVVLTDAGVSEALVFARRVLQQISGTPVTVGDTVIHVTVSIGIAIMSVDDIDTHASLSRSDEALYQAKDGGRNRIEVNVAN